MSRELSIGIDLGIASVGWAVYDVSNKELIKQGVYKFSQANKAEDRRTSRALRRRYGRTKYRIKKLKKLLNDSNISSQVTTDSRLLFKRIKGLDEKISEQDIVNILFFFIKQRGYIPFDENKDEVENHKIAKLEENIGKYPCQVQKNILETEGKYRSTENKFLWTDYEREIRKILNKQKEYYDFITDDLIENYLKIYFQKRKFWEGPGAANPNELSPFGRYRTLEDIEEFKKDPNYRKYLYEDLIGICSVYIDEKRVPVSNFYAEKFNLFNDLINLTFKGIPKESFRKYFYQIKSNDDREFKLNKSGLYYILEEMLKINKFGYDSFFKKTLGYSQKNDEIVGCRIDKDKKPEITNLSHVRKLIKVLDEKDKQYLLSNLKLFNKAVYILTVAPSSETKLFMLKENNIELDDDVLETISNVNLENKYHSFGEKALIKYIELMEENLKNSSYIEREYKNIINETTYRSIVENYPSKNGVINEISTKYIDDLIASPQVKKSLRKAIYILNALIKQYRGDIKYFCIESNTELLSTKSKNAIEKEQGINEKIRKDAAKELEKNGYDVTNKNIIKQMLLTETNYKCGYCGCDVKLPTMEVDHIIPISISFDDSYVNKITSCTKCNNDKLNRAPLAWLNYNERFIKDVKSNKNISSAKMKNLLFEGELNKFQKRFINRNLRDTSYATKELIKQIGIYRDTITLKKEEMNLPEAQFKVLSVPPKITGIVRNAIEDKKDRNLEYHHAQDATIIAAYVDSKFGKISLEIQNEPDKFWKSEKFNDMLSNKNNIPLNYVIDENLISVIKEINYKNTYFRMETTDKIVGKLSDANIQKVVNVNGNLNKINQINDIYAYTPKDNEFKLLKELFGDKENSVLMKQNDIESFDFLKEIFNKYKDVPYYSENSKKEISINPFIHYCIDEKQIKLEEFNYKMHGIRPLSKNGKERPIILKLRYLKSVNNPYLLEKESINKKEDTMIMLDTLSQAYTELYYSPNENKYLFLPIYSIFIKKTKNGFKIDKNNHFYKLLKEEYINKKTKYPNKIEYIMNIYNNDYMKITKKNGDEYEGFVMTFDKYSTRIEFKTGQKTKKFTFTSNDKTIKKINIGQLGRKDINI